MEIISGLSWVILWSMTPKKENKKLVSSTATASPSKPESTAGRRTGTADCRPVRQP